MCQWGASGYQEEKGEQEAWEETQNQRVCLTILLRLDTLFLVSAWHRLSQIAISFCPEVCGVAVVYSPLYIRKGAQVNRTLQSPTVWAGQAYMTLAHCSVTIPTCFYDHCRSLRGRATHLNPFLADLYDKGERILTMLTIASVTTLI